MKVSYLKSLALLSVYAAVKNVRTVLIKAAWMLCMPEMLIVHSLEIVGFIWHS